MIHLGLGLSGSSFLEPSVLPVLRYLFSFFRFGKFSAIIQRSSSEILMHRLARFVSHKPYMLLSFFFFSFVFLSAILTE